MTDKELMQQALEALRFALHVGFDESSESQIKKGDKAVRQHENVIAALRERLAQQEQQYPDNFIEALMYDVAKRDSEAQQQEPVAWMHPDGRVWTFGRGLDKSTFTIPLYTSPPASKPWVGLTDEEIDRALDAAKVPELPGGYESVELDIARAIEAKLREKNA